MSLLFDSQEQYDANSKLCLNGIHACIHMCIFFYINESLYCRVSLFFLSLSLLSPLLSPEKLARILFSTCFLCILSLTFVCKLQAKYVLSFRFREKYNSKDGVGGAVLKE